MRRGEGIGRALVTAAEDALLELGCPKVQLMVRPDNDAVLGFYDSLGYERFDTSTTGKRLVATDHPVTRAPIDSSPCRRPSRSRKVMAPATTSS